ncbi:MAG: hypothetical protein IJH49_02275 [Aeriscardovia sp.]|nr:hypothetical protein [Aeriscardovia sp.]
MYSNIGSDLRVSATAASLLSNLPGIVLAVACMLYETLCDFLSPKKPVLRGVGALIVSSIIGFLFSRLFWVVLVVQVAGAQLTGCVAVYFSFMRLWWLILVAVGFAVVFRRLHS